MIVSGFWLVFAIGCLGGLSVEILRWWKLRDIDDLPNYYKRPFYWIISALMILIGGFLSTFYGVDERNALAVLNIGISAPAIIAMASKSNRKSKDVKESLSKEKNIIRSFLSMDST